MLKAIDLYSGVGGWSLGFRLAGIPVSASYEWDPAAVETARVNCDHEVNATDVRSLSPADLPVGINVIIGSPPCTEFSFSNRGGGGDLAEGLRDIVKFLELVAEVKPLFWAMENVPRVGRVLEEGIRPSGALARFKNLIRVNQVVNMSRFGLPQARRRTIAGNFPIELISGYERNATPMSLRKVLDAFRAETVVDPIYAIRQSRNDVIDHDYDAPLEGNELRMNLDAKSFHPVYNFMEFPDDIDQPSRTITATCTRMTRESIVVEDQDSHAYRRLTLRERALLQGFPLSMPFGGRGFNQRLRLIGNAIPPPMAYLIANAMLGVPPESLPPLASLNSRLPKYSPVFKPTPPIPPSRRHTAKRAFRAAIPNLHLHSGVRFELANSVKGESPAWTMRFIYGDHLRVLSTHLGQLLHDRLRREEALGVVAAQVDELVKRSAGKSAEHTPADMQSSWSSSEALAGPYALVDSLGAAAGEALELIRLYASTQATKVVRSEIVEHFDRRWSAADKLLSHAPRVCAGLLIGTWFNCRTTLGSELEPLEDRHLLSRPERDRQHLTTPEPTLFTEALIETEFE